MNVLRQVGVTISAIFLAAATPAAADKFVLADGEDVIGAPGVVQSSYEETLLDIGRRYGLGYEEIRRANPAVDVWLPGGGTTIDLPTQFLKIYLLNHAGNRTNTVGKVF